MKPSPFRLKHKIVLPFILFLLTSGAWVRAATPPDSLDMHAAKQVTPVAAQAHNTDAFISVNYGLFPVYNRGMERWAAQQGRTLGQPRNVLAFDIGCIHGRFETGSRFALGLTNSSDWNVTLFYLNWYSGYAFINTPSHRLSAGFGLGLIGHSISFNNNNRPPALQQVGVPSGRSPRIAWTDLAINPYLRYNFCPTPHTGLHAHQHRPLPVFFNFEVGYVFDVTTDGADYGYTRGSGKSSTFVKLQHIPDADGNVDANLYGMVGIGFHIH
jgi:hypothetical protein